MPEIRRVSKDLVLGKFAEVLERIYGNSMSKINEGELKKITKLRYHLNNTEL
jgi:hypothetical protein